MNRDTGPDDRLARAAMRTASEQLKQSLSVDATAGLANLRQRVHQRPGKTRRYSVRLIAVVVAVIAIVIVLVGPHIRWPGPISVNPQQAFRTLSLPESDPSTLIVIADPTAPSAQSQLGALVAATARPGEHLVVLGTDGGSLYSGSAPVPPTAVVPQRPPRPAHDAPALQRSNYELAVRRYQAELTADRAALVQRQKQELAAWAADAATAANSAKVDNSRTDLAAALDVAALSLTRFEQVLGDTGGRVIVILGSGLHLKRAPTELPAGLKGSALVASGFSGGMDSETAWQADMLEAGAATAIWLGTPDDNGQLANVVRTSLGGTPADTIKAISFAKNQVSFTKAAFPQLQLLPPLIGKYPQATVIINGYADELQTSEENQKLSQERAQAVSRWLVAHGIAGNRLKVIGHGGSDDIRPSPTQAQPSNRSVVIVVEPVLAS
jgi:outer membrane protein OmpA-like peptidoglycan-associated protein